VSFLGDDGAGGVDSARTRIVVPGETALIFRESPSGPRTFTPVDGNFSGFRSTANHRVQIAFQEAGQSHSGWQLTFGAPQNAVLGDGFYPGASIEQAIGTSAPLPTYPVLDVEHNTFLEDCQPRGGLFEVKQVQYGDGGAIESFWARFEEHCSDQGSRAVGEIRFNARIEVAIDAALSAEVAPGHPLVIPVTATDRLARHVTLTVTGLPQGANFVDHGDNTASLTWTPGPEAIGLHDVTFAGDNGSGGVDHASTHVRVTGQVRLLVDSDAQDPVGAGTSALFGAADGIFLASKNYKEGVSFHFIASGSSYPPDWFVDMAGPHSAALVPGVYDPVSFYPYEPDDVAGLSVTRGYDPCSGTEGRFEVEDIQYGPGAEIASLRAAFEQRCAGSTAAVRGELRWNYDAPILIFAPASVDTSDGALVVVPVHAVDRAGGTLTLAATGLPAGAVFTDRRDNTGALEWTPTPQQVGDYRITFHARNAAGQEDSTWTRIHVRHDNRPPVVRLAYQSPVRPGVPTTFDASGTTDPDGDQLQYSWYFTDDRTSASQPVVKHTYATPGNFLVLLYVTDSFNKASAETLVHVEAVLPARAFVAGGNAVVRLATGKPTSTVQIEPRDGAWEIGQAVLSSIAMLSPGTGSVDRIEALTGKTVLDRDTDHDGLAEISATFAKGDLEQLFGNITGHQTVQVTLQGQLASGDLFEGTMDLPVSRPGGALAAEATPSSGRDAYRLSFETSRPGSIHVKLFNVAGRCVRSLADQDAAPAGPHELLVDRKELPSGLYFYRIVTPEGIANGKLVLVQ